MTRAVATALPISSRRTPTRSVGRAASSRASSPTWRASGRSWTSAASRTRCCTSEIATRYVRDARRALDPSVGPRAIGRELVTSGALAQGRALAGGRGGAGGGRRGGGRRSRRGGRGRGRGRGGSSAKGPAGRIWRRDGAAGAATSSSRRGGARARRPASRRPGRSLRPRRARGPAQAQRARQMPANNPFRKLFKKDDETSESR